MISRIETHPFPAIALLYAGTNASTAEAAYTHEECSGCDKLNLSEVNVSTCRLEAMYSGDAVRFKAAVRTFN